MVDRVASPLRERLVWVQEQGAVPPLRERLVWVQEQGAVPPASLREGLVWVQEQVTVASLREGLVRVQYPDLVWIQEQGSVPPLRERLVWVQHQGARGVVPQREERVVGTAPPHEGQGMWVEARHRDHYMCPKGDVRRHLCRIRPCETVAGPLTFRAVSTKTLKKNVLL